MYHHQIILSLHTLVVQINYLCNNRESTIISDDAHFPGEDFVDSGK